MSEPCPHCNGGEKWSPHWACSACGDTGLVVGEGVASEPRVSEAPKGSEIAPDAPSPTRGRLGAHIRRTSAQVDTWPEWMKPAYLKEADRV